MKTVYPLGRAIIIFDSLKYNLAFLNKNIQEGWVYQKLDYTIGSFVHLFSGGWGTNATSMCGGKKVACLMQAP